MIARLWCKLVGHRRGKRTGVAVGYGYVDYQCPRCLEHWSRKVKEKVAA